LVAFVVYQLPTYTNVSTATQFIFLKFYVSTVPPTVHAVAVNNSVVGVQEMSILLRFQVTATPSVNRNDIIWMFNRNLILNTITNLHDAGLSFSSNYLSLSIANINCNVSGRYELSATNVAGESNNYIQLIVDGMLNFISHLHMYNY